MIFGDAVAATLMPKRDTDGEPTVCLPGPSFDAAMTKTVPF